MRFASRQSALFVAAEHDLKCARAADQAREPFQRSAARDQSDADLGVAGFFWLKIDLADL